MNRRGFLGSLVAAAVAPFVRTDTQRQKRPTVDPEEMALYIEQVTERFRVELNYGQKEIRQGRP
jgi:hypothetical protein